MPNNQLVYRFSAQEAKVPFGDYCGSVLLEENVESIVQAVVTKTTFYPAKGKLFPRQIAEEGFIIVNLKPAPKNVKNSVSKNKSE